MLTPAAAASSQRDKGGGLEVYLPVNNGAFVPAPCLVSVQARGRVWSIPNPNNRGPAASPAAAN